MSPQVKKKAKPQVKPPEADEPREGEDTGDEGEENGEDEAQRESDEAHERKGRNDPEGELEIRIRPDAIEVSVPRDGNESDTFERIARLVEDL